MGDWKPSAVTKLRSAIRSWICRRLSPEDSSQTLSNIQKWVLSFNEKNECSIFFPLIINSQSLSWNTAKVALRIDYCICRLLGMISRTYGTTQIHHCSSLCGLIYPFNNWENTKSTQLRPIIQHGKIK